MTIKQQFWVATTTMICFTASIHNAEAVSLEYAGQHMTLGQFPGATLPYTTTPWRTSSENNTFSPGTAYPDQYYGRDGYAMFSTYFSYPNENIGISGAWDSPFFIDEDDDLRIFNDLIDLPSFVTDSLVLSANRAGGWEYALIDDPERMDGIRHWTFDGTNYPPAGPPDNPTVTGLNPYVKMGVLSGWDRFGNNPADPESLPAGRWGFQVGADVPDNFRVGVMTDGYDGNDRAPTEIFLGHVTALGLGTILDSVSTGVLTGDRHVDMHFFDISGAEEGDIFAFGVKSYSNNTIGALSGFTFDILPDAPALVGDYNEDGTVNIADYTIWRDSLGSTVTPGEGADGDNNGTIDASDYTVWKNQFGQTAGSFESASVAAPEPSTMLMLAMAAVGLAVRRRW